MNRKAQHDISKKSKILNYAKKTGNIAKTCRYFGICRETFYSWKRAFEASGEDALVNNKPCPENHKLRIPRAIEKKLFICVQHITFAQIRLCGICSVTIVLQYRGMVAIRFCSEIN